MWLGNPARTLLSLEATKPAVDTLDAQIWTA